MSRFAFGFWRCAVVLAIAAVAGCTDPATRGGTYDPYEGGNRGTHAGNIRFDQNIARPLSQGYGNGVAPEVRLVVNNFRSNFEEPSHALNALLQGRIDNAVTSTGRFLINSTVGLLGLFDPASDLGIDQKSTDFGETMFVWGVNEGAYVELPVFGPHTTRHAVGRVVDVALNPLNVFAPSPTGELSATSYVASSLDFRYELTNTIDGILYDSEDSYLTARNLYLQQRRAQLSGGPSDAELTDPFADLE